METHKEYKVQMLRDGKWRLALQPFGGGSPTYSDREGAEQFIATCREAWNKAVNIKDAYSSRVPAAYRIISRTVTLWEPEA